MFRLKNGPRCGPCWSNRWIVVLPNPKLGAGGRAENRHRCTGALESGGMGTTTSTRRPSGTSLSHHRHSHRRGFILIWGRRTEMRHDPSFVPVIMPCARCGQRAHMVGVVLQRYFTLFFLPISPIGPANPLLRCAACGATYYRPVQRMMAAGPGGSPPGSIASPRLPHIQSMPYSPLAAAPGMEMGVSSGTPKWVWWTVGGVLGFMILGCVLPIGVNMVRAMLKLHQTASITAVARSNANGSASPLAPAPNGVGSNGGNSGNSSGGSSPPLRAPALPRVNPFTRAGNEVNLLTLVDPGHDAVKGVWSRNEGVLTNAGNGIDVVRFPATLPEEYDVDLEFARLRGDEDINVILTAQGSTFLMKLGGSHDSVIGVDAINGHEAQEIPESIRGTRLLAPGRVHHVKILVRKNAFETVVDDSQVYQIRPRYGSWSVYPYWRDAKNVKFGLITLNSATQFRAVHLTAGSPAN